LQNHPPPIAQFLVCRAEALGEGGLTLPHSRGVSGRNRNLRQLAIGYRLLAIGDWLSAIANQSPTDRQPVPTHANLRTA
jgi:hypothetical protein